MSGELFLRVFDVEHGACAILASPSGSRVAMIDCGHNSTTGWRPSSFIRNNMNRTTLDYLFVTNADQDHLSDLDGLWQSGIHVSVAYRNPSPTEHILRMIKQAQGDLTNDVERFLQVHRDFNQPITVPFDNGMDGVTMSRYWNSYPDFIDTNNLSMVTFIKYGTFKILFPGDLEKDGWKALLKQPAFVSELTGTNILVASHHGRENGFCAEIFDYFTPRAVVISDKPIAHETQQMVPDYRAVVHSDGVIITNQSKRRHVLTTRRDGDILFKVDANGNYWITTA